MSARLEARRAAGHAYPQRRCSYLSCLPPRSLFRNLEEVEKLSELGVLFLLFEMGLELSIDRLRVGAMAHRLGLRCRVF